MKKVVLFVVLITCLSFQSISLGENNTGSNLGPKVISTYPNDYAKDFRINDRIEVKFDRPVNIPIYNPIEIIDPENNMDEVSGTVTQSIDKTIVYFEPSTLQKNAKYEVVVRPGFLIDENGNENEYYTFKFFTETNLQIKSFDISSVSFSKSNNEKYIDILIDRSFGSMNSRGVKLIDLNDNKQIKTHTRSWSQGNSYGNRSQWKMFIIGELNSYSKYKVVIDEGAIKDQDGNPNKRYEKILTTSSQKNDISYKDVPKNHWAYSYIVGLTGTGKISGFKDNTFRPNTLVTREQFAKLMITVLRMNTKETHSQSFADVSKNRWSYNYIENVKDYIPSSKVNGVRKFNPQYGVTRLDATVAIVKALGQKIEGYDENNFKRTFKDYNNIQGEMRKYVYYAHTMKLIKGFEDGTFKPNLKLTRAQAAALLYNCWGR